MSDDFYKHWEAKFGRDGTHSHRGPWAQKPLKVYHDEESDRIREQNKLILDGIIKMFKDPVKINKSSCQAYPDVIENSYNIVIHDRYYTLRFINNLKHNVDSKLEVNWREDDFICSKQFDLSSPKCFDDIVKLIEQRGEHENIIRNRI